MNKAVALLELGRGKSLVAELPSAEGRRSWLGIYPLNTEWQTTKDFLRARGQPLPLGRTSAYRIRLFEVDKELIKYDIYLSESDLQNKNDIFAFGEDDLEEKIKGVGIDFPDLNYPFNTDYPI